MGAALAAMAIATLLLGYPAYLGIQAYNLPLIYDITTDPIDPPRYDTLARVRPRDANPIVYAGLYAAELQREAYPDIEPLTDNDTPQAPTMPPMRSSTDADGASSTRARRRPRVAKAASRRWRARRSWASATTSSSGCAPTATARASTSARRRATARSISAPTRRASAA